MLAFVFCLHAHLKRFLSIITSQQCHISKRYTRFIYRHTQTWARGQHTHIYKHQSTLYLKCRSITFTRQCNVIKISSCILHKHTFCHNTKCAIVNRFLLLLLIVHRWAANSQFVCVCVQQCAKNGKNLSFEWQSG